MSEAHGERELQRIENFCEKFLDDGRGGPWTLKGREYVREEIWKPLVGFRQVQVAHAAPEDLCAACRAVYWSIALEQRHVHPKGHLPKCPGLEREPIVATLINIPRRNAKTHSLLSFAVARCFLRSNQRIAFFAAAEDQADELLDVKAVRPLSRHPGNSSVTWDIRDKFTAAGNKLLVPARNSWIEVLPASHASTTGRGNTMVIGDECRDIKTRVIAAVLPTLNDAHGWECPRCFKQWIGEDAPAKCPNDAEPLEHWFGRAAFASSAGPLTGDPARDWFPSLVAQRLAEPVAACHVFVAQQTINPAVSLKMVDNSRSIVSGVPLLEDLVEIEARNQSIAPGETYVKPRDVQACVDRDFVDRPSSDRAAVWFLDTSDKVDLTTLAVLVDDAKDGDSPFSRVALQHLMIWDPRDPRQFRHGTLDDEVIVGHLAELHTTFTRLRRRAIDTRGRTWAMTMLETAKREAWARGVEHYSGKQTDDDAGFQALHDYVLERRFRMPKPLADEGKQAFPGMDAHARLLLEIPALKKVRRRDGSMGVEDPNADRRGRNKNKLGLHRDAAAAVAGACLLAVEERRVLVSSSSGGAAGRRENPTVARATRLATAGISKKRW